MNYPEKNKLLDWKWWVKQIFLWDKIYIFYYCKFFWWTKFKYFELNLLINARKLFNFNNFKIKAKCINISMIFCNL